MVRNTKELKIINTVNRITTTVEKIPNLKLLILFGSRARGEHRQYEAILSQTNYRLFRVCGKKYGRSIRIENLRFHR
ncbi:MAG: hypothetical protein GPJ11_09850 [Microcystis aeruginosa L211-101]|jgi:hypothetical protein|nr:hypothetical protein [Microcystis aeruginosa L211-11]NCR31216.1 hypothetical protein [Microcystis aeruginosa L211-101]